MKRVFPQVPELSASYTDTVQGSTQTTTEFYAQEQPAPQQFPGYVPGSDSGKQSYISGKRRKIRTSVALISLALSMGTSSLLLPQQIEAATAAASVDPLGSAPTSDAAGLPTQGEIEPPPSPAQSSLVIEHVIQEGESLWQLAMLYQVDPAAIAASNHLSTSGVLQVGQILRIPTVNGNLDLKVKQELSLANLRQKREQLKSGLMNFKPQESAVGVESLSPSLVGTEQLVAYSKPATEPVPLSRVSTPSLVTPSTATGTVLHQVNRGETLKAIALNYGVSVAALAEANRISDPNLIFVNQTLKIPQVATNPASVPPAVAMVPQLPVPRPAPSELAPTTITPVEDRNSGIEIYRVSVGDTLEAIAQRYGVSATELIRLNSLENPNLLHANQLLQVPKASMTVTTTLAANNFATHSPGIATQLHPASPAVTTTGGSVLSNLRQAIKGVSGGTQTTVFVPTLPSVDQGSRPDVVSPAHPLAQTPVATMARVPSNLPVAVPASVESTPPVVANPYVENLKAEVVQMQARYQPALTPVAVQPTPVSPVSVASQPLMDRQINPEFIPQRSIQPRVLQQLQTRQLERQASVPNPGVQIPTLVPNPSHAQPQIIATAPLGVDSFTPLTQLGGQMVSPELPPLSAPDTYLPGPANFKGYIWPAKGLLTSGFGMRWGRMHRGIDIAAPIGTPVVAAATGVVESAGWNSGGYGNLVEIRHPDGSLTLYAHNNRILVREGQFVEQGQQIAEMGSTGFSTGPHSHFEVHPSGQGAVNPIAYLPRTSGG
ncbi:hypothetical protein DO97_05225 [Neosynechococcus sphagnicola sy1]|uniref:LysM domain-containing protein n=1 Tax=Neosynechococcus sphagnicola sy1 TaxID=1497020 RepID=A0A098TLJ1_9CYAN|nr:LysM peptidoglycan-binding domain-containing protein [Neosynechococcus sphagnicola]KGF72742.1 hypothetical protein DO97_05225 [Neosynechococcus sphagnicola sy1]